MLKNLLEYGINLPAVLGFAVAVTVSTLAGRLIGMRERKLLVREKLNPDDFDLKRARTIGTIECVFYIYAVMVTQYSLIPAWLVMKSFFTWLNEGLNPAGAALTRREKLALYHLYLDGNAFSLLLGLFCGRVALVVQSILEKAWNRL